MIQASRRRRDDARDDALSLHRRLAGGEAWHRKLTVASGAALAASAVSWIAGAPLAWHAGIVLGVFVVGLLWPVRDATERALAWIAERAGLAYETALADAGPDPYGLRAAVSERARASSARLRAPPRQRWWIALLAVAFGLLLLPAAQLATPAGGTSSGTPQQAEPADTVTPEPMPEEPFVEPERPEDPARAAEPEGPEGAPSEGAAEDAAPGGGSEQDALSRVLDNLRERDPFQPVDPNQPEEATPPPSEPRAGEPGDPAAGEQQQQGAEQSESDADQEPGDPAEGAGRSEEGQQDGDQGNPEDGPEEGQEEGTPGPSEGPEDQLPQEGETSAAGEQPGGEDEGQLEPDASSGIGEGPSSIRPSEGTEGDPQTPPEFLPGQLEQGPENPGGTVLLPGEDQIDVPPSLRSDGYRRAVEEAVTDGQVPLEYQEIIRNYFR